jgi:ubiquinone/menaquinone biosynthesis C-methylase UbiE
MSKKEQFPYLHGFSRKEQDRLKAQARFAEHTVYQDVDLSSVDHLLEVGCGVGAQSEIILRRFPDLHLRGIDFNKKQLETAKNYLSELKVPQDRYELSFMDATQMDFEPYSFDGAWLCWVLEHIPSPSKVLGELRRVLKPGGIVYITEVMNSSFFLDPYSPNVWKYWMAFNDFQYESTGDPFIGAKLGNLLVSAGFRDIETKVKTWHFDNRNPQKRQKTIEYWSELLMSARDALIESKQIDEKTADLAQQELERVAKDPDAVFYFSFMQATAKNY